MRDQCAINARSMRDQCAVLNILWSRLIAHARLDRAARLSTTLLGLLVISVQIIVDFGWFCIWRIFWMTFCLLFWKKSVHYFEIRVETNFEFLKMYLPSFFMKNSNFVILQAKIKNFIAKSQHESHDWHHLFTCIFTILVD